MGRENASAGGNSKTFSIFRFGRWERGRSQRRIKELGSGYFKRESRLSDEI
jgi:hypothetical protein